MPAARAPGRLRSHAPVQMVAVAPEAVVDQDEYLASLTSRHSITLYAQVSGVVLALGAHPWATSR